MVGENVTFPVVAQQLKEKACGQCDQMSLGGKIAQNVAQPIFVKINA
jgi:hypothetical protein